MDLFASNREMLSGTTALARLTLPGCSPRPRSSFRRSQAPTWATSGTRREVRTGRPLVEQQDVCSYGEPFIPTDIDLLLGEETVALRGPWNVTDLVEIGPAADDLVSVSNTTSTFRAMRSTQAATTTAGRSA